MKKVDGNIEYFDDVLFWTGFILINIIIYYIFIRWGYDYIRIRLFNIKDYKMI